jgi:hypothetical protein
MPRCRDYRKQETPQVENVNSMQSGDASRTVLLSLSLDSLLGNSYYPIAIAQTCEMFRSACVNPTVLQTRKLREASKDELSWLNEGFPLVFYHFINGERIMG